MFIEYLKQGGLFDGWVADCPLLFSSPNAPEKRDLLGTVMLSVLSGHYRYAHITMLRRDAVNPALLGMKKVISEDAVRRGLAKIGEAAGQAWLQTHLDYCLRPLLRQPWVLDVDSTIKPLYGHQGRSGDRLQSTEAPPTVAHLPDVEPAAGAWGPMCSRATNTRRSTACQAYGR
jgi:hypothetical protein